MDFGCDGCLGGQGPEGLLSAWAPQSVEQAARGLHVERAAGTVSTAMRAAGSLMPPDSPAGAGIERYAPGVVVGCGRMWHRGLPWPSPAAGAPWIAEVVCCARRGAAACLTRPCATLLEPTVVRCFGEPCMGDGSSDWAALRLGGGVVGLPNVAGEVRLVYGP